MIINYKYICEYSNSDNNLGFEANIDKSLVSNIQNKIIKETILPEFDKDNYYIGIKRGISDMVNVYW